MRMRRKERLNSSALSPLPEKGYENIYSNIPVHLRALRVRFASFSCFSGFRDFMTTKHMYLPHRRLKTRVFTAPETMWL